MNENEQELDGLSLDEIMKEFGASEDVLSRGEDEVDLSQFIAQAAEENAPEDGEQEPEWDEPEEPEEQVPQEDGEPAEEPEEAPAVSGDTVRLDDLSQAVAEAASEDEAPGEPEEPVQPAPPKEPIVFDPRARLRELKRKLIAGPEKRYYELSEMGLGKLQAAIVLCLLIVGLSAGAGALYAFGMVPEDRLRLMIFSQVLAMLGAALLSCYQLMDGVSDLFHGRFTLNTMLVVTFVACCVDSVFCFMELRVPLCAAFALQAAMALWSAYQRRNTEMGMMDTMRKAIRLNSVVKCEDYYEGRPGFLRGEGQVEDFVDHYHVPSGPEKRQNFFALLSLAVSAAVAIVAGVLHSVSMGVQIFSTTLLVSVPASAFVAVSRPMDVLERRLHALGTVLCGWQGVRELSVRGAVPLSDTDIFPVGATKMNGVKFYGDRDPEETIAYATALICANGGGLAPIFQQLLASRNGPKYQVRNIQYYGNGGIGGEICGDPVLIGTLQFLQEMGVEIPEGTMVNQAVYVSVDGELSGLFAITYSRMKHSANGMATLCGYRGLKPVLTAEDFMLTDTFLKEKFAVNTKRIAFLSREEKAQLAMKAPEADAPALALTTQEGLAPSAYAITGARALKKACNLGVLIHILGGGLGMLIMLALAVVGAVELLTPLNILLYQLIWLIPGLLVTEWTRTI